MSEDVDKLSEDNQFLAPTSDKFDIMKALTVFAELRGGESLKKACENAGINLAILHTWRRLFPKFASRLDEALEDRAYFYEDMMHDLAMDPDLPAVELNSKVSALEKLAKMGNTKRYNKQKTDSENAGGVTFVINTGVPNAAPTKLEDIIYVERDETSEMSSGSGVDLQGYRGGADEGDTPWWDSGTGEGSVDEGQRTTASTEGDGGDESRSGESSRQEIFGGVGSVFTRRGGGEE